MQDQICMEGRDFRDQNDAEKLQETKFPGASQEGLNPSIVLGIAYAARANKRQNMRMQREGVPAVGVGGHKPFRSLICGKNAGTN